MLICIYQRSSAALIDFPDYGIGTLAASIERINLTILARSAALVSVSTPEVPALRCATLLSTSSSEIAAPLWKKVWGNAKRESSEGGTYPFAPSGAAAFW